MRTNIDGRVRDSVTANRYKFLTAVQELAPEVLAGLERNVLPSFRALFRETPSGQIGEFGTAAFDRSGVTVEILWSAWPSLKEAIKRGEFWTGPSWAVDIRDESLDPAKQALRVALAAWASNHRLASEAIKDDAFATLRFWLVNPQGARIWAPPGFSPTMKEMADAPKLHIDDTWNFERWPAVKKRLEDQISIYRSEIQKYCVQVGFDLEKMRDNSTHHQWLALFQCREMSPGQILNWHSKNHGEKLDPSAVSHAIKTLAKKIGLELRPGIRGRRRSN